MEQKYYFISYLWSDLSNNFYCEAIDIHPMEWFERVNRGHYYYTDKKGKEKSVWPPAKYKLISWNEITKEQFDSAKHGFGDYDAKRNITLSYGKDPY